MNKVRKMAKKAGIIFESMERERKREAREIFNSPSSSTYLIKKRDEMQRSDAENKSRLARRDSLWMVKSRKRITNASVAAFSPPTLLAMKNKVREETRNKKTLRYLHEITSPLNREKVSKARGA
ncbi:MAG: hypothetical protein DRN29_10310 [Thermoplasmata archaeon]|nr:MAG: hypothetical protein DRN29_10310 [Thermoplasmata archaeon]